MNSSEVVLVSLAYLCSCSGRAQQGRRRKDDARACTADPPGKGEKLEIDNLKI